jgi:hypothetical protein
MLSKIVAASIFAIAMGTAYAAADPYEGLWVRNSKDCAADDVENSRTGIEFFERARSGGSIGLFDRYEHHCRIVARAQNGNRATLRATCFNFWEDLEGNRNSFSETHRLVIAGPDRLTIDGKAYRRCASAGARP